jgi:hypothetical protein
MHSTSRIDIEEPRRIIPYNEVDDPILKNDLTLSALPIDKKSITLIALPNRVIPYIDRDEPSLAIDLIEIPDPAHPCSIIDISAPKRISPIILKLLPILE